MENNTGVKRNTIIIIIVLIIVVILGLFLSKTDKDDISNKTIIETDNVAKKSEIILNAKKQFKDGIYTIVGEIETPTPCYKVSTSVSKADDSTIFLDIFTQDNSGGVCTTVVTNQQFSVSFEANKNINISATLNGQPVELNLFEIGPNEDINKAQIYLKG